MDESTMAQVENEEDSAYACSAAKPSNQLKPPFPLQKQGSFYEPKHCKHFFFLQIPHIDSNICIVWSSLCRGNVNAESKYQSLSV